MRTKIPSLSYDAMFKAVFSNNKKFLAKLVESIIKYVNLDIDIKDKELVINRNELPIDNYHDRNLICDYFIKLDDDHVLNIEINRALYRGLVERNMVYSFKIYCEHFKTGDKKTSFDKYNLFQVNFNAFHNPNDKSINRYFLIDVDDPSNKLTNNYMIMNIDIEKCFNLVYNKTNLGGISDLETWGAVMACTYLEDIETILESGLMSMSKEDREEFVKKVDEAAQDKEITEMLRLESSIDSKLAYVRDMERAYTREEVIKEITDNHIKAMIEHNISLETISEITGKPIRYIESLRQQ